MDDELKIQKLMRLIEEIRSYLVDLAATINSENIGNVLPFDRIEFGYFEYWRC